MIPLPLQITFRDTMPSDAVRSRIKRRAAKLRHFHPRIQSCRVVVRSSRQHPPLGHLYSIRIQVKAPRHSVVITHAPEPGPSQSDIYVAIRDAFDALDRRLEDVARRNRGELKAHSRLGRRPAVINS